MGTGRRSVQAAVITRGSLAGRNRRMLKYANLVGNSPYMDRANSIDSINKSAMTKYITGARSRRKSYYKEVDKFNAKLAHCSMCKSKELLYCAPVEFLGETKYFCSNCYNKLMRTVYKTPGLKFLNANTIIDTSNIEAL